MAEAGVTYADLRFAKTSAPEQQIRPPGEAHEEASDGELTYENFPAARPRQPAGPDPPAPGAVGRRRRRWSLVPLALLGACLFLLAACLGLGLRYGQVYRELEWASQRHTAESSALAKRMGSQEENLTWSLGHLSRAQAELNATRLALWQSWQAGNATRRQLEQHELAESRLQQEKDEAIRELEEARSCQQRGCCPPEWTLFRWKCLWVSSDRKTWEGSRQDCERQGAQLLLLKPWDAGTIWGAAEMTVRRNHLAPCAAPEGLPTPSSPPLRSRIWWGSEGCGRRGRQESPSPQREPVFGLVWGEVPLSSLVGQRAALKGVCFPVLLRQRKQSWGAQKVVSITSCRKGL